VLQEILGRLVLKDKQEPMGRQDRLASLELLGRLENVVQQAQQAQAVRLEKEGTREMLALLDHLDLKVPEERPDCQDHQVLLAHKAKRAIRVNLDNRVHVEKLVSKGRQEKRVT